MASFDLAYNLVARAEGGYQNLRSDAANQNSRGEWVGTNWGIIPATYERATGRVPSESDMRSLTKEQAKEMFRQLFWTTIKGDQIPDQQLANIFFDGHVNHGTWGIQLMQRTLGVIADGVFGPLSLAALTSRHPEDLFNAYKETRRLAYEDLLRRRPWMENPWRRVWENRLNTFNYVSAGSASLASLMAVATVAYLLTR